MGKSLRVLVVEDSPEDAALLVRELQRGGYSPVWKRVDTPAGLRAALAEESWDVLLVDYNLPGFNALNALKTVRESRLDLPFIVVSGSVGEEIAVETMRSGAHDYIMKGNLVRLIPAIEREIRECQERLKRRSAEETASRLAWYDPVTGLPNRVSMRERLRERLALGAPLAVLLLDLDRFREINDTLGHHLGDVLLQQVGQRLQDVVGERGVLGHMGGDEFAVLMPDARREEAAAFSGEVLKALEKPFPLEGLVLDVGASLGIALFPEHGSDADLLLRRADVAMYWAKGSRGGWAVYAPEKDGYKPHRLALLWELRQALDVPGQLSLAYQPKVDLKSGVTGGVEALARWTHPAQGLLLPEQFVPLAERTALIRPFTIRVLKEALDQALSWRKSGLGLRIAVNLSARNLEDPAFPDQLGEMLGLRGLKPDCLELEVTESAIMSDADAAIRILGRMRGMGIRLSIDDYGIGYSSLEYLKRLPVDALKVDKSFVLAMTSDPGAARIVRSTVNLAHDLGLKVVAEGVENDAIRSALADLGCDEGQGYHLARPMGPEALARWIGSGATAASV